MTINYETSKQLSDKHTVAELRIMASRALCAIIHSDGEDALKVLTLQMLAAGGNNRVAVETIAKHFENLRKAFGA
jgi:hypothetical protein